MTQECKWNRLLYAQNATLIKIQKPWRTQDGMIPGSDHLTPIDTSFHSELEPGINHTFRLPCCTSLMVAGSGRGISCLKPERHLQ